MQTQDLTMFILNESHYFQFNLQVWILHEDISENFIFMQKCKKDNSIQLYYICLQTTWGTHITDGKFILYSNKFKKSHQVIILHVQTNVISHQILTSWRKTTTEILIS